MNNRLRLREVARDLASAPVEITVDVPTGGVAILDVMLGGPRSLAPLHWRTGDWTKPPLDLSMSATGRLERVNFVLQDEEVRSIEEETGLEHDTGVPCFDVRGWSPDRYRDGTAELDVGRTPSGELVIALATDPPVRGIRVGGRLRLEFDGGGALVLVGIGPLDRQMWRRVGMAAGVAPRNPSHSDATNSVRGTFPAQRQSLLMAQSPRWPSDRSRS